MGHAARQMADRFHLLGLAHRTFGAHAGSDVGNADQKAARGNGRLIDIELAPGPGDMLRLHRAARTFGRRFRRRQYLRSHSLQLREIGGADFCQPYRQFQQLEETGIEGAQDTFGREIGDTIAYRVQGCLQDRRLIGPGAFGHAQADIVSHQQGRGDQQNAQGQNPGADGKGDLQCFLLAALYVARHQQSLLFCQPGRNLITDGAHLLARPRQRRGKLLRRRQGIRLLDIAGADVQSCNTRGDQLFQPVGPALLIGIVGCQAAQRFQVRGRLRRKRPVTVQEEGIVADQIAPCARLGRLDVILDGPERLHHLIGMTDQGLGIALIGRELDRYISDDRQHQKQRHRGQQDQPVCSQDVMRPPVPRAQTHSIEIGSRHRSNLEWLQRKARGVSVQKGGNPANFCFSRHPPRVAFLSVHASS